MIAAGFVFVGGFVFGVVSIAVAFRIGSSWAQATIENNIKSKGVTLVYGTLDDVTEPGEGGMVQ